MNALAHDEYLTNEVMTASPQKLQLMLIEATIRAATRAKLLWEQDQSEAAGESLVRAQECVAELLAASAAGRENAVARQVAAEYSFIFRSLVEAHLRRDVNQLDGALGVLEEQRKTWQQVCSQLGYTRSERPAEVDSAGLGFTFQA